jgi:hypothetical protein
MGEVAGSDARLDGGRVPGSPVLAGERVRPFHEELESQTNSSTKLRPDSICGSRTTIFSSRVRSALNVRRPSLSEEMGSPFIEPEVSRRRTQGQRGSGFSANSTDSSLEGSALPPPMYFNLDVDLNLYIDRIL